MEIGWYASMALVFLLFLPARRDSDRAFTDIRL